ncbi:MAG: PD40 domain-containing protein [Opitutaceae bacterium]|nr:PD40 domain-containing protein [Opitutaceae bacterium]
MQIFQRLFLICVMLLPGSRAAFAQGVTKLGEIVIQADVKTIAIHVTGSTPELERLAHTAFGVHGRYRLVSSGGTFSLQFSAMGANQVKVDITRGGSVVASQVFSGTSLRNGLLRAADFAVEKTSGLKGFFASRIAFIVESGKAMEVATGDLFFGEVRQITQDRSQALTPRWSPDGRKLLYTSYFRTGFPDIFLLDLGTFQRSTFVSFKGTNMGGRFSPNGQQVAMVLSGEGNPEVYVSNAQGRQISRRTHTAAAEAGPCFSPDGLQMVYVSDSLGGPQLFVMPAAGGTSRRLATNISRYCAEPDWSRGNPNMIAFTIREGNSLKLAVHDLSGRTATRVVSKGPGDCVEPSWLADGRHLVYTQRLSGGPRLAILDTETGKSTFISGAGSRVMQANVWGP